MEKPKLRDISHSGVFPLVLSLKPLFSLLIHITHLTEWTRFGENWGKSVPSGWRPSCVGPKKQSIHCCLIQPALWHQVLSPISSRFSQVSHSLALCTLCPGLWSLFLLALQTSTLSWKLRSRGKLWALSSHGALGGLSWCPLEYVIHGLACIPGF